MAGIDAERIELRLHQRSKLLFQITLGGRPARASRSVHLEWVPTNDPNKPLACRPQTAATRTIRLRHLTRSARND
eukprot:3786283-Alexandrium_andersonii.AAC.1